MITEEDIIRYHESVLRFLKESKKGILVCSLASTKATEILKKHGYEYKWVNCSLCGRPVIFPKVETEVKPVCIRCYLDIMEEDMGELGGG